MANKEKTKKKSKKITPLMLQYQDIKTKYPDAILLFRVGDFYETFGEDAVTASDVLGIILTKRNNGGVDVELAGFPYHSVDTYLPKLVKAGYRVAICEQLEKPSKEKKIVKRGVTELITPGLAVNDKILDHKSNNFLAAVSFGKKEQVGIAFLDVSTGEFMISEGDKTYIDKLIQSFNPMEVIFPKRDKAAFLDFFGDKFYVYPLDEWIFTIDYANEKLYDHFQVKNLKGFGVVDMDLAQIAAGACIHYLATTENANVQHINRITRLQPDKYVWLDRFTIRNLELIYSPHDGGVPLINILDQTISPMGARLLKKWVVLPLKVKTAIDDRLEIVTYFIDQEEIRDHIIDSIKSIGDLERLISKVPLAKINPREIVQLKRALLALAPVKEHLRVSKNEQLMELSESIDLCPTLSQMIEAQIMEEPPVNLAKGGVIADGANPELDEYRNLIKNSKDLLLQIQQTEAEKTGIANLKIGFNNVFGYYLEVTNKYKNQGLIPDNWIRKQTLTNAERYITEELKKLETKILSAEGKMLELENNLFEAIVLDMNQYIRPIQKNSMIVAKLDCLLSFANVAIEHNYCRPEINDGLAIDIKEGRHPVIEQHLELGESYVPNDVFLDNEAQQIMMITGPNMSGKSAILRQTALVSIMAQMGSYVSAKSAKIGILDKVFTRVGASDNISSGESTFMVEMNETASIMNNVSERSLILLDEIGRGTSTYDGISIAWSIAEYLHDNPLSSPKTLFATHYHELNELAEKFDRIHNFNVATKEVGQKVIFLRKLQPGGSLHSFGIHVAKMAGMPKSIVDRATNILSQLEKKTINNSQREISETLKQIPVEQMQLKIFEFDDPAAEKVKNALKSVDLNAMTPIECMMKLKELMEILNRCD